MSTSIPNSVNFSDLVQQFIQEPSHDLSNEPTRTNPECH